MEKFNKEKWTHRALPLLIASIIVTAPLMLLPNNWWGRLANTAAMVPILTFIILNVQHGTKFCEYCAEQTPADGLGTARRKSRTLKFFHAVLSPIGYAYLAAMLFVPSLLPRVWPFFIAWTAFQPPFLFWLMASRTHNLLLPWCPWCNGGDGGLREPSPDPSVPEKV